MKKILTFVFAIAVLYSCDTTNESGYIPASYTSPQGFSLTSDATASTDISFEVTYTPSAVGKGYYIVLPAGSSAPSSTAVHAGGGMQSGTFDVDGSTPINITVDAGIYGGYGYDVYAIHKSTDNFISEEVTKLNVVTPDTMDPVFDRPSSSPAHNVQPGSNSPFTTVTLAFTEPVFYQGGDITFNGFFGGRNIVVNNAADIVMNGLTMTISVHGTFAPDDAVVVGWAEGTFKDNSGKSVAALTGFDYYFWTRAFTIGEQAQLTPGEYNYSTVFYGGLNGFYTGLFTGNPGVFLPSTGTYEITADASDATGHTFNSLNLFSGFLAFGLNEPQTLPFIYSADDNGALAELGQTPSIITAGQPTYWSHYIGFFGPNPGFYDFAAGNITVYYTLFGATNDAAVDDIDYVYNRIGTYARGSMNEAIQKSKEVKAANPTRVATNPTLGF